MKLNELSPHDIEKYLEERLRFTGKGPELYSRYSAYDYCYNYFRDFHERKKYEISSSEMNILCLQLGLFLGTWGMFRNSVLQKSSFKVYETLVERIFKEKYLWEIDVEDYCNSDGSINSQTCKAIMDFKEDLKKSFGKYEISVTDTLATKIMMVVFGCVPAYDSLFKATLHNQSVSEKSLKEIYDFYSKHKKILNQKQNELKTVDVNGGLTDYPYKKAKIIDLIGFHVTEEERRLDKEKRRLDKEKKSKA